jgi:tRNA modification GTPase
LSDTIFALSSGAPPAAIGVLRVSGPKAHEVVEALAGKLPPPRRMSLRVLREPDSGATLDRALVVQFPAGESVSGEPLAELHLHGGRATIDAVENVLGSFPDVRRARAGEFTWRAFQNGRLDLVQVESLSDLLRAETEGQRQAALAEEGLSGRIEDWRKRLLLLSALVEAALDQSDEDDVPADRSRIDTMLAELVEELEQTLARPGAERLFEGVRVVFAGSPNTGKSSLINAIVDRDVAITSPIAGTTRDVIEAPVQIGGVAFILTDTAGLREASADPIEQLGMHRAEQRIANADLVVWMDDSEPRGVAPEKLLRIFPRADEPERGHSPDHILRVSAVTGEGISELSRLLIERAQRLLPRPGDVALSRRQRSHLARCRTELIAAKHEPDELVIAERLRACRRTFDELTGRAGTEELLDALFGTFCIGK